MEGQIEFLAEQAYDKRDASYILANLLEALEKCDHVPSETNKKMVKYWRKLGQELKNKKVEIELSGTAEPFKSLMDQYRDGELFIH